MEKNMSSSKSPYEQLIPNKKKVQQKSIHPAMTEEEMIRNEAWHGAKTKTESDEELRDRIGAPVRRGVVHSLQETRLRTRNGLEATDAATPVEKKNVSAAEVHASKEREEKEIEAIAKDIYEHRMQGVDAAGIDKILADKGIRPWTPEAEEFMRTWDWEQAEQVFRGLEQERAEAAMKANEAAPKAHVELHEYEQKYVEEKFAPFGIDGDALESIEGFDMLSYGQRLLLAENLNQLTLGRVHEEAIQKYQEDTRQSKFLGKVWKGITKKYQIAKHEQSTAADITKGGLAYHGDVLKQLVEGTKRMGVDVIEGKGGTLEFQYVESHSMMTERQKEESKEFNRIATAYSKVPYEWSLDTATATQKREYQRVLEQFEKAKEHILRTERDIIGDKDALLFVSDIESKIRLNQFFNTHPDAEKQLQSIESDAAWNRAMGDVVTERGLYFGAGVATRTFAISLLGAVGFPLAAMGMGGWMGRKRAAETLRERERAARQGKRDTSNEATNIVTADALARKIDGLVRKIESEADETKRQQLIAFLQVRLEYTKSKIDDGRVDFGSVDRRIVNQYDLMDKLTTGSSVFAVWDIEQGGTTNGARQDVKERLDQFLQFKDAKISRAQKDYLRKQMIYGAGLGVAAFAAGYYAKGILHAAGLTEAYASEGGTTSPQSIMKDYIPQHPNGSQPMPAHGSVTFGHDLNGLAEHAATPAVAAKVAQEAGSVSESFHGTLDIGTRGPEGAFIDELKKHPEIVQRLGIKDIGKEAHVAWAEFAKQELKDPRTQDLLEKLGYPKTQHGYAEMMRHIDHGKIMFEEQGGKLHMRIDENSEYLRATTKASVPKVGTPAVDVPTGPQVLDGVASTEKPPVAIDVDRAMREQPIEGILSPMKEVPRSSVEVFADHTFGLDSEEYNAIKDVPVKTLLNQIPSRDEAWAIWRGEVPGKEIALPHDGIYGAMEFKKHIDLAEHVRGLHPNDADMDQSVDAFIKEELHRDVQSHAAHIAPSPVEAHAAIAHVVPSGEDVPTGPQVMENVARPISPEKFALLSDDIYNSRVPVQKIITQYKVGNITPEDFARYYVDKVVHAKPSPEMLKNIKKTFSDAAGEGVPIDRANAQNAISIMVKRMQGIK